MTQKNYNMLESIGVDICIHIRVAVDEGTPGSLPHQLKIFSGNFSFPLKKVLLS